MPTSLHENNRPDTVCTLFADVILPVAIPGVYTYCIPQEWAERVQVGSRVLVEFGKKRVLTGVVHQIHPKAPEHYAAKPLLDYLDLEPSMHAVQLRFFFWLAAYYMCTPGEALNAALPSGLKLTGESLVQLHPDAKKSIDEDEFSEKEIKVLAALQDKEWLSFSEISDCLGIKTIHPVLKSLLQKERILLFDRVKDKFKPKTIKTLRLAPVYFEEEAQLKQLFAALEKRPRQQEIVLKYLSLVRSSASEKKTVTQSAVMQGLSASALKTLAKHGIFIVEEKRVSRLAPETPTSLSEPPVLSGFQQRALDEIHAAFQRNKPVLLHGITGSGKTEVYIRLIEQVLESGGQVLYLLPEIALTTQIVSRLQAVFGSELVGVYHSKYSDNERVEVWHGVRSGAINLVLGARSAIFLPFEHLSLMIIDEEHEPSYKQYDPSPRYHARDAALWLAHLHQAKTLLGTATPSIESYQNTLEGKYERVSMLQRFGEADLPVFETANLLTARKQKRMKGLFTPELIAAINTTLEQKQQVILFQNRRGYSPYLACNECNHVPKCQQCEVSLTYHLHSHRLVCHYCGYTEAVPATCAACQTSDIRTVGFGTEKIEEDLKILFPQAHVQRMDQDTTRSKYSYQEIITRFEQGKTDILVGTQMLSKGLDFDRVTLVGIFDYDRMIHFPDFRSHERAFQLITQVSGRAGRKHDKGKVIVQTAAPHDELLYKIMHADYLAFFQSELLERERFLYPPFFRLIKVILRHKDPDCLQHAAHHYAKRLVGELGQMRVLGPQPPSVSKIRNLYIQEIYIKLEQKEVSLRRVKAMLLHTARELKQQNTFKSLRLHFDVDPM